METRELKATARARGEALKRLEPDKDALTGSCPGMAGQDPEGLAPEERHRVCKLPGYHVRFHPHWSLEIPGVYAGGSKRRSMICSTAILRHVAYKGIVQRRYLERTFLRVR